MDEITLRLVHVPTCMPGMDHAFASHDLLGASPAGLPLSENRLIDADPFEIVRVGDEHDFPALWQRLLLQVTGDCARSLPGRKPN